MSTLLSILAALILCALGCVFGEKFVINLTITENKGGGENIINLKTYVTEKKLKLKPSGSFELISNEAEVGNYFLLDSKSGILKLRSNVDREAVCKHTDGCGITILVAVDDNVLEVVVRVLDQNDNGPQFAMRYKTITVQENSDLGLEMSLPTAEDADSLDYGIARYYIEDPPSGTGSRGGRFQATKYFRVVEKTINGVRIPYLKTTREVDREEVDQFELILVAEDVGKQRGSCTVTVTVADVNDNSPQWPTASILRKVRECDRQGPLLELQAFDRDDASLGNGQVKYKISDHSPKLEVVNRLFYIAGANLFLSSHSLQTPEIGTKVDFFVTAVDGGGRENDTAVTIEIEDCNDHSPSIQLSRRSAAIPENERAVRVLATITVKDDDRGANAEFSCELNDTSLLALSRQHSFHQPAGGKLVMFQLEKIAGVAFDREKVAFYSVVIRCVDQGRPSLTGEKMFSISVLDRNDNPPRFSNKEVRFSITENNFVGALIGFVRAFDADSLENGRISYQILNDVDDDNVLFAITTQGKLEAKWKFDRETKSSYSFSVLARDHGDPSLNDSCLVRISVLDENDCLPIFKNQYFYQVQESAGLTTIHAVLGKVSAEDQDLGENGTVHYQIKHHNKFGGSPLLKISADGTLSVYGVVDREKIQSIQADVVALDSGRPQLSSVTTVIVDVLDLNDNKPRFKNPGSGKIAHLNVSADTAVGTILASLEATDPDKGENGTISYSIVGHKSQSQDNFSPFQLQQDGRLILIQNLKERDSSQRLPDRLLIKAADGGDPPLLELLTLHIKYIMNEHKMKENLWTINDRKLDKNKINTGHLDGFRENESADNMILLYVLAGVLFTVFIIVLLVLMYTYFSGKFIRRRNIDHSHEKQLNNIYNDPQGNYECELLTAGSATDGREDVHKVSTISMAFPIVEKGNYTHLTMNDSKYTPIQITPNYFQSMYSGPTVSLQQSSFLQSSPPFIYEPYNPDRVGTSVKTKNRLSNKWNSIENVSQIEDATLDSNKRNENHSFLYNAHSLAAYINQFGNDDTAQNMWKENISVKTNTKQPTLNSVAKLSKDDQSISTYQPLNSSKSKSKKCYVTSSFV